MLIVLAATSALCFKTAMTAEQWYWWTNKTLVQAYDSFSDLRLKKWEINLTDNGFIRLRKTFANGKQEYYSFHLHKFKDLDYLGTSNNGTLQIKALADDIIVQTYNDPHGDIDSMATSLSIHVKNVEPEQLDSLRQALLFFKDKP
ncbi:hypothetical protein [Mucilaginibacter straminoryzae]|uniref:hypothetical protein n=1 Tax=Mucilaginibacter straminoryzae TaxID=2932774 RepID=UPI001FD707AB|nr:hypothetical protein [Mucilaginibacter straminoryzae]